MKLSENIFAAGLAAGMSLSTVTACSQEQSPPEGTPVEINAQQLDSAFTESLSDDSVQEPGMEDFVENEVERMLGETFAIYDSPNFRSEPVADARDYDEMEAFCYRQNGGTQEAWVGLSGEIDGEQVTGYAQAYVRVGGVATDTYISEPAEGSTYAYLADELPACDTFPE